MIRLRTTPFTSQAPSGLSRWPWLRSIRTLVEQAAFGLEGWSYVLFGGAASRSRRWFFGLSVLIFIVGVTGLGRWGALKVLPADLDDPRVLGSVFHAADGALKLGLGALLLACARVLRPWKGVYAAQGALNQVLNAFESGEGLTVENVGRMPVTHPRSWLGSLVLVAAASIVAVRVLYWRIGPWIPSEAPIWVAPLAAVADLGLVLGMTGLVGELVRKGQGPFAVLQRLCVTRPSEADLEVAVATLRQALRVRRSGIVEPEMETDISSLQELGGVSARAEEFAEPV